MVYVAVAEACALAVVVCSSASLVRSLVRQQHRERDLLLNQLLHAAGKTWTPPPASQPAGLTEDELLDRSLASRYTAAPEQETVW